MRLELDRIRARIGRGIDERMGRAQRPIMGLCHLGDQIGRRTRADLAARNLERRRIRFRIHLRKTPRFPLGTIERGFG